MYQNLATVIFALIFSIIFLISYKSNKNPLKLTTKGIRVTAILALVIGAGIYQVATNFSINCDVKCLTHWGNPLGK